MTPANSLVDLERAEQLKHRLKEFVVNGALQSEFREHCELFEELSGEISEDEVESVLDSFIFDWFDDGGESAIEHFLSSNPDLTHEEKVTLLDWNDSLNSVFQIKTIGDHTLKLRDLDSNEDFHISTLSPLAKTPFERGQYITGRILPLGDGFIFSGLQVILPDRKSAKEVLEIRRNLDEAYSPEAMEKAQREQCDAFCDFFGCDEVSLAPDEINARLQAFQNFLLHQRRDSESGLTVAEKFRARFGHDLPLPEIEPPSPEILSAGQVTILCDEFDGLVLLPDFPRFKRIFTAKDPDQEVPGWRDLLWRYIKDADIPIVAFERVAEQTPKPLQKIMRLLLNDNSFSLEHLYAALLHYKQPVEGFEDLDDERLLWDLFEGKPASKNRAAAKKKAPVKAKATARTATPTKAKRAAKPASKAATKVSKKAAAKR